MTDNNKDDDTIRLFRPALRAASDNLKEICQLAVQEVMELETRKRKRTAEAQLRFEQRIDAIICNALHAYLSSNYDYCAVPRSKVHMNSSRYKSDLITKDFPVVLDQLDIADFVTLKQPKSDWHRQRLFPSEKLIDLTRKIDLSFDDFDYLIDEEETIILKTEDPTRKRDKSGTIPKKLKEYPDTDETNRFRKELTIINNHLHSFDVNLEGAQDHDFVHRQLVRSFNDMYDGVDFAGGGRLWGGTWQNMSKKDRRSRLMIDGQKIAEVDFNQMMPCLMYTLADKEPPQDDLYDVSDYSRAGLKKIFNAMTFRGRLRNYPDGVAKYFNDDTKVSEIQNAIKAKHKSVAHLFQKGLGHKLQRMESDILVKTMLVLAEFGCPCLPIHDALLCRETDAKKVAMTMENSATLITGYKLRVSIK
ncbi:hypothetical protein [Terasakiella sp.]|uniref:hypothetical protein n=1 Tax=Terasakiella sp. TaxID=2034861 RepID=UPI003AA897C2